MKNIFIETRGTSIGYDWFDAENNVVKSLPIPDLVKKLADTEFESLILYRQSNELILAITDLKSDRIDNRTRPIRNSLIWIADNDNDEEAKIRSIIIEYLEDKETLEKQIVDAITRKPEIKIDSKKIEFIVNKNNPEIKQNLSSLYLDNKIGNLDKYKKELIDEIKSYSLPEKKDGLLILITDSKSEKTFKEMKPWRGLSNKIENEGWMTLEKKPQITKDSGDYSKKTHKDSSSLFSIILVVLLIISNSFWFYQNNQLNQRINELEKQFNQIQSLQLVIDKSKADVAKIKTNLEDEIVTARSKFDKAFSEAQKEFNKAQEKLNEAQEKLNQDIVNATSQYETNMAKVQQTLSDSLEKNQ